MSIIQMIKIMTDFSAVLFAIACIVIIVQPLEV